MILQALLVISIVLQVFAVGVAIKLTKVTKYNFSWILLTVGFVFMAVSRLVEFLPYVSNFVPQDFREIFVWIGVTTSLCFAIGVFFIQKIFKYIKRVEDSRRLTEKMFLNAVIQAEEKERKRFAKDLHDGLGPLLSTVKMSVSSLAQLEHDASAVEIINNTEMVINEAIKSLKEISNNLSPHVLNNFGLLRAITSFSNKINAANMVHISIKSNLKDDRFDSNTEVVLYRVLCELINNTIKHANAKNIHINLNKDGNCITIVYKDDGHGFDVKRVTDHPSGTGMGISNVFSRISSLKGEISIESDKQKGTLAYIKVKIENE